MCGRYALHGQAGRRDPEALSFGGAQIDFPPRYNLSPMQAVPVYGLNAQGEGRLRLMQWGLIPGWAKDPAIAAKLNNARAETVAEKPAFRDAFRRRRCLVPVNGFYEWQREGARKTPHYFSLRDGGLFAVAGIYDTWRDAGGEARSTFAVLTTAPNALMAPIHDRMPVILPPQAHAAWLDVRNTAAEGLEALLAPYPAGDMQAWPVSARVNSTRNDDAQLIQAAAVPEAATIGGGDVARQPQQERLL
ncbi:MAG: SOS response-associated peptidase [Betaproteobacteria bacterium]|nr:SOS response-associated peptidase [Betaproteobacteria bacterium]